MRSGYLVAAALNIDMSRKSKAGFHLPFQTQAFFSFFITQCNASSHVIRLVGLRARLTAYQQNAGERRGQWNFGVPSAIYYLVFNP